MLRMRRAMMAGMVCVMAAMGSAGAAVTGVTGQALQISAPASATFPALAFSRALTWNERVNVAAPAGGFVVNMLVNGATMSSTSPTGGVVQGVVDSHFIHWSPLFGRAAAGTVTFSAPILGVIFGDLWLNQSDGALGAAGTIYPSGSAAVGRGIHPWFSQVTASGSTLSFNFQRAGGFGRLEQVRVLTRAVPGPGGLCVAGLAALGCVAGRRR